MDDDEEEQVDTTYCSNCERDIPTSAYQMHEVHCIRNIVLCPKCREPVPRVNLEEHNEDYHTETNCDLCGKRIMKDQLEEHQMEDCRERKIPCKYCDLEVKAIDFQEHAAACGSRTDVCDKCLQRVLLRNMEHHHDNECGKPRPSSSKPRPSPPSINPYRATPTLSAMGGAVGVTIGGLRPPSRNPFPVDPSIPIIGRNLISVDGSNRHIINERRREEESDYHHQGHQMTDEEYAHQLNLQENSRHYRALYDEREQIPSDNILTQQLQFEEKKGLRGLPTMVLYNRTFKETQDDDRNEETSNIQQPPLQLPLSPESPLQEPHPEVPRPYEPHPEVPRPHQPHPFNDDSDSEEDEKEEEKERQLEEDERIAREIHEREIRESGEYVSVHHTHIVERTPSPPPYIENLNEREEREEEKEEEEEEEEEEKEEEMRRQLEKDAELARELQEQEDNLTERIYHNIYNPPYDTSNVMNTQQDLTPHGGVANTSDNYEEREEERQEEKEEEEALIPCELCKRLISFGLYQLHMNEEHRHVSQYLNTLSAHEEHRRPLHRREILFAPHFTHPLQLPTVPTQSSGPPHTYTPYVPAAPVPLSVPTIPGTVDTSSPEVPCQYCGFKYTQDVMNYHESICDQNSRASHNKSVYRDGPVHNELLHTDPTPHTNPIPAHRDPIPAHRDPIPAHRDPIPAHRDPIPAHTDPIPPHTDPIPAHRDPIPPLLVHEDNEQQSEEEQPTDDTYAITGTEEDETDSLPCQFCNKLIPFDTFEHHQLTCDERFKSHNSFTTRHFTSSLYDNESEREMEKVQCTQCQEYVPINRLEIHEKVWCKKKSYLNEDITKAGETSGAGAIFRSPIGHTTTINSGLITDPLIGKPFVSAAKTTQPDMRRKFDTRTRSFTDSSRLTSTRGRPNILSTENILLTSSSSSKGGNDILVNDRGGKNTSTNYRGRGGRGTRGSDRGGRGSHNGRGARGNDHGGFNTGHGDHTTVNNGRGARDRGGYINKRGARDTGQRGHTTSDRGGYTGIDNSYKRDNTTNIKRDIKKDSFSSDNSQQNGHTSASNRGRRAYSMHDDTSAYGLHIITDDNDTEPMEVDEPTTSLTSNLKTLTITDTDQPKRNERVNYRRPYNSSRGGYKSNYQRLDKKY